jgi:hypothetical protein
MKNLSADAKRFHGLEAHVDEVFGHIDILFISKSFWVQSNSLWECWMSMRAFFKVDFAKLML